MINLTINLNCPEQTAGKTDYVLKLISSATTLKFGIVDTNADIVYGGAPVSGAVFIPAIPTQYDYSDVPPRRWHYHPDYAVLVPPSVRSDCFNRQAPAQDFDLFGAIYACLTGCLNNHNEPGNLYQGDGGFSRPLIRGYFNYFIELLKQAKKLPTSFTNISPWKSYADFAVGLSHDIDIFSRSIKGSFKLLADSFIAPNKPGGVKNAFKGLTDSMRSWRTGETNPYSNIAGWLKLDQNRSTYFVFDGKRTDHKDPVYKPADVKMFLESQQLKLPETATHCGIESWQDRLYLDQSKADMAKLFTADISGLRPHYLSCRFPELWQNSSSYSYSSTVGSDSIPGFTAGIDIPFFGFDFDSGQQIDILELPLSLMDCTICRIKNDDQRNELINQIFESCRRNHSLLVLDWHNRTNYQPDFPGWVDIYGKIFEKARAAGAYIDSLDKINKHWRKHCESLF